MTDFVHFYLWGMLVSAIIVAWREWRMRNAPDPMPRWLSLIVNALTVGAWLAVAIYIILAWLDYHVRRLQQRRRRRRMI